MVELLQYRFCVVATPTQDMYLHLSDKHQKDLVIRLPLQGKGYNIEYKLPSQ
jgi:hypothetical protein